MINTIIKPESLPLLGEGRSASVYSLDEAIEKTLTGPDEVSGHKVLKLFKPAWDKVAVEEICKRNIASCSAGIPFVKAHSVAETNGRYGLILDRIDGESVDILLTKSTGKERSKLLKQFTDSVKRIHGIKITTPELPDQKQFASGIVDRLPGLGFTSDEADAIRRIVDSAPDGDGYLHGDCHTGNAILQDGEILFLDADYFTGKGAPVFDLCCMYSHYVFMPSLMDDSRVEKYIGMTREDGQKIYREFIEIYFSDEDSDSLDQINTEIIKMQAAKVCLAYAFRPGLFDRSIIDREREQLRKPL